MVGNRLGIRVAVVFSLLILNPAAPGGGAQEVSPRILTPLSELATAEYVDIEVPESGFLAVFELRPGKGLGLAFPLPGAIDKEGDGRVKAVDVEEMRVEEGVFRFRRPRKPRPTRSGTISTFNNDWDLRDFSYFCRPGSERSHTSMGRWLLVVLSREELRLPALWKAGEQGCAIRGAEEQALAVMERIAGLDEPRPWAVALVRY